MAFRGSQGPCSHKALSLKKGINCMEKKLETIQNGLSQSFPIAKL